MRAPVPNLKDLNPGGQVPPKEPNQLIYDHLAHPINLFHMKIDIIS
jgi:hypothetical protein